MKFNFNGETRHYIDSPHVHTMKMLKWGGEVSRWCEKYFGPRGWDKGGWDSDVSRFIFKDEKNYMLALLRWGNGN